MSAQTRPSTSIANSRNACASFIPPRPTHGCSSASIASSSSSATFAPALSTCCPLTRIRRAMISDCALVRESTIPRSTSATSRRCLEGGLRAAIADGNRHRLGEELAYAARDPLGVQVVLRAEDLLRAVVHVLVGHADAVEVG